MELQSACREGVRGCESKTAAAAVTGHAQQRTEMAQDCRCHLRAALAWLIFFASRTLTAGCNALKLCGRSSFGVAGDGNAFLFMV